MERVMVIGAGHLLGHCLLQHLRGKVSLVSFQNDHDPFPQEGTELLDITDPREVQKTISSHEPDTVFLAGGLEEVELCERNPDKAWKMNAEGAMNIAQACLTIKARFVFVSSDLVFNGLKGAKYQEFDIPDPLNLYGQTKLEGERLTMDANKHNLVCRMSSLYGWVGVEKGDVLVVGTIVRLRAGEPVFLDPERFITPGYGPDVAKAMSLLANSNAKGIYHVAGSECVSQFYAGKMAARTFDLDESLLQHRQSTVGGTPRRCPPETCLSVERVEAELDLEMAHLAEGLRRMRVEEPALASMLDKMS